LFGLAVGRISLHATDHIGLLVHRTFNVSIDRAHIPGDGEWEYVHGPVANDPELGECVASSTPFWAPALKYGLIKAVKRLRMTKRVADGSIHKRESRWAASLAWWNSQLLGEFR
jgi:hypothetical protein